MTELRAHFLSKYPVDFKAGQIYRGDKEVSFFTFTPLSLRKQKLKVVIVFNHQKDRFEVWLAGQNKDVQKKYWTLFKDSDWNKHNIPNDIKRGFSIVDSILVAKPSFKTLDKLKLQIESKAMTFVKDIEEVLV